MAIFRFWNTTCKLNMAIPQPWEKLSCPVNRQVRDPYAWWCEGSGITINTFADSVGLNVNRYSLPLDWRPHIELLSDFNQDQIQILAI